MNYITVSKSAIDQRGHVNNLVYLQWYPDTTEAHWVSITGLALWGKYVWYVLSHQIDYKASAFEGEDLQINTRIASFEGIKSERHYKIFRIMDQKILVEAKTLWCLLTGKTLRPTKITSEISTLFI
jgi:acyl-CoA thioester hydrolase